MEEEERKCRWPCVDAVGAVVVKLEVGESEWEG